MNKTRYVAWVVVRRLFRLDLWSAHIAHVTYKPHAGYGRPTLKGFEQFWLGSVRLASKAMKIAANQAMNLSKDFTMNWMPMHCSRKAYVRSVFRIFHYSMEGEPESET